MIVPFRDKKFLQGSRRSGNLNSLCLILKLFRICVDKTEPRHISFTL